MSLAVMLAGSISKAPETRTSAKGNSYTVATICTGEGDDALFINVTAFGELADTLAGLAKGDPATIIGNAKVSTYQGRDGDTKAGLSITASRIIALVDHQAAPRHRTDSPRQTTGSQYRRADEQQYQPAGPREFADDMPF